MAVTDLFRRWFSSKRPSPAGPSEEAVTPVIPVGSHAGQTSRPRSPASPASSPSKATPRPALAKSSVLATAIARTPIRRVTELGIADVDRTRALLADLASSADGERIQYAAVDPFEARTSLPLPARSVYSHLAIEGVTIRLVPGRVRETLPVAANTLTKSDLLLVGPEALAGGLLDVWRFVPRMVTDATPIVVCDAPGPVGERTLRIVTLAELARLAQPIARPDGHTAAAA